MENVHIQSGFTKIANDILENIVKYSLNGTQWRIVAVVWRYTYGFNRNEHELSETFISKATGIGRRNVRREMGELIRLKLLKVVKEASFTTSRTISFNKDFEIWVRVNLSPEDKKDSEGEIVPTSEGKNAPSSEGELTPKERNTLKKNIKKDICPFTEIVDLFNNVCISLPKVLKVTESRKKKIASRWGELPDIQQWKLLFEIVENIPFLKGENSSNWKASLDWLIDNDKNIIKVLEGQYKSSSVYSGNKKTQDNYRRVE